MPETETTRFREAFQAARRALVAEHGPAAFDQAEVLYLDATGRPVVVRDAFYGATPDGPVEDFLARLTAGWWSTRRALSREGAELTAVSGLYARYLGEVGYDWMVELGPDGPIGCWRSDARGRTTSLALPADEGMFRDQTGTFFDVRAAWRWLVARQRARGRLVAAEVQPGYVIGARPGAPGDPSEREDPELAAVFSRFAAGSYDALEFLGGAAAADHPFHGERYLDWLDPEAAAQVTDGAVEIFVLAKFDAFVAGLEDLCERAHIEVAVQADDDDARALLALGPLRVEVELAYPFLRTLHTGRSFVEGTRAFYLPVVQGLEEAAELLEASRAVAGAGNVRVEDGRVMVVSDDRGEVGRWSLMALAGRLTFRGAEGRAALARLLERRPDRLDACPLCGGPARVGKIVRPAALAGEHVGVSVGKHAVLFTREDAEHSTPVSPGPGRDLGTLEAAYEAGIAGAVSTLVEARRISGGALLVGFDAGSWVLDPRRVKAALVAAGLPADGERVGYAFFPDALVVADATLGGRALRTVRLAALEAVQPRFPGRTWALDLARPLRLDGVEPAGQVEHVDP